jgi:hypothetical protein
MGSTCNTQTHVYNKQDVWLRLPTLVYITDCSIVKSF